ncbi:uncharacterized protein [Battus philenor]|uniref:uncharacterized protein isoform X1 n=1 Tax=Battus philenor TaxID=42288 RepID=UPI0035D0BC58
MGNNMMHSIVLLSAFFVQLSWSYGSPNTAGVGVFVYEDSAGHRYECVYKPKDYQEVDSAVAPIANRINEATSYDTNWPDAIFSNIENQQRAAYEAAQNSFSAFNAIPYIPYIPNFDFRFPSYNQFRYSGPGNRASFNMPGSNFAFASGAVGPGYRHQVAAINPMNPANPNVDVSRQTDGNRDGLNNRFYSVSSSSYASSVNDNGQSQNERGAETIVNDNGKVTRYSVHN